MCVFFLGGLGLPHAFGGFQRETRGDSLHFGGLRFLKNDPAHVQAKKEQCGDLEKQLEETAL